MASMTRDEAVALLEGLAEATRLAEGSAGMERVVRALLQDGPLRSRDLARAVRLPVPVVAAIRREMESAGLAERSGGGAVLSDAGRTLAIDGLGLGPPLALVCPACEGRGVVLPDALTGALEALRQAVDTNPGVDVTLDQAPCTPETAMARVALMHRSGALEGRRVLILGDDDSVGLAIGLFALAVDRPGLARRVTVLDIDQRRLDHMAGVADRSGLSIEYRHHDLRDPLPDDLVGRFDVFETDPAYTLPGLALFLTRAMEAMEGGSGRQGFLSFASRPPAEMAAVIRTCLDAGLVPEEILPGFNRYQGASLLGSTGQMIRLVTTGVSVGSSIEGRYDEPIYTGETSVTLRTYRCKGCGLVVPVGQSGRFTTIEALKEAGCPACGSRRFAYKGRVRDSDSGGESGENPR